MSEQKRGWYVLRAISGKENKVKEYLDAEIKNTDLGDYVSQVLIPTEKVYSVRNGKKITKEKNLPDVFRGADLDSPDMEHIDWQTVRDDTEGFIQDVIDEAKKRLTE